MGNKWEELEACVQLQDYGITGLTERWLDSLHNWSAAVAGYRLCRKDRPRRGAGGGVAFYVREQRKCTELCLGTDDEPVKNLWVGIRGKTKLGDAVVTVHHRLLEQEEVPKIFLRQLEEFSFSQTLVWMGNINQVGVCWKSNTTRHKQCRRLLECVDDTFLRHVIEELKR